MKRVILVLFSVLVLASAALAYLKLNPPAPLPPELAEVLEGDRRKKKDEPSVPAAKLAGQPTESGDPAKDWPFWRGPNRDDISRETGLLKQWPEGGPKLLWLSREAKLGYTGPSIVGGRLFTAGADENEEHLLCFDAATGQQLWSTSIGRAFSNDMGGGPRATPTVDGGRVYMLSGEGNLVCAQVQDGEIVWQKDLTQMDTKEPRWGYSESVLIDGDQAVCTPGSTSGGAMAAFHKRTGELLWQSKELLEPAHYSSIVPTEMHGVRQYVQVNKSSLFGIAAKDGKLLWREPFAGVTVIPTPIVRPPYAYATAGQGTGCLLVKVNPDLTTERVYANKSVKNQHGGMILLGDHLYGHSDPNGWVCQEFVTGQVVWAERSALGKGGLTCADGLLYCVEESKGTVVLAEASPKGWHELSRFTMEPQSTQRAAQGKIWTHPVVSNGRLYLRDQELLYCYDVRAQ